MSRTALSKLQDMIAKYDLQKQFVAEQIHGKELKSPHPWDTRSWGLATKFESMLSGHYGFSQHTVELNALVMAVRSGCIEQLLARPMPFDRRCLEQYSQQLSALYNLDVKLALWAVTAWAMSFGKVSAASSGLADLEHLIRASGRASINIEHFGAQVIIDGGELLDSSGKVAQNVSPIAVSRYQTTWAEWNTIRAWAIPRGYEISDMVNPDGCSNPVHSISWHDAVKWCNARSEMEGLSPVYMVERFLFQGKNYKSGITMFPAIRADANGYRLPSVTEWVWAAQGGKLSKKYLFSGSNTVDDIAWFSGNSGRAAFPRMFGNGTRPVGKKAPNELGLFDMSGNVAEWCWDVGIYQSPHSRRIRGGCWNSNPDRCTITSIGGSYAHSGSSQIGFRVVRSL